MFIFLSSLKFNADLYRKVAEIKCLVVQVMLGVDRLDMIKGIPQKLLAFEKFLEDNPNWRDKVVLLMNKVYYYFSISILKMVIKFI